MLIIPYLSAVDFHVSVGLLQPEASDDEFEREMAGFEPAYSPLNLGQS